MTRVKICGITNIEDALAAVDAGADMIGLLFADSPRRIDARLAREIVRRISSRADTVGVFMDQSADEIARVLADVRLDVLQLHGDETPDTCRTLGRRVLKRIRVGDADTPEAIRRRMRPFSVDWFLLDPGAGSGRAFDWRLAADLSPSLFVSGGLTAENVAEAVRIARPLGVDVSSGVESEPGRKDHAKVRAFVRHVREADARNDE
jgi:phosphoribosylanthranilate isomerase